MSLTITNNDCIVRHFFNPISSIPEAHDRCHSISDLFKRIIYSPLFWLACKGVVLAALTVAALVCTGGIALPLALTALGVSLLATGYFVFHLRKLIYYEVTLLAKVACHALGNWTWWHKINDVMTLGSIPLKNLEHLDSIPAQTGAGAILTLLEPFELEHTTLFTTPVLPEEWKAKGIEHKLIEMDDLGARPIDRVDEGVEFIEQQRRLGRHVYLHCKAGVGRSATVAAGWLLKYGGVRTPEEAKAFIERQRPKAIHIHLLNLKDYHAYYCN